MVLDMFIFKVVIMFDGVKDKPEFLLKPFLDVSHKNGIQSGCIGSDLVRA